MVSFGFRGLAGSFFLGGGGAVSSAAASGGGVIGVTGGGATRRRRLTLSPTRSSSTLGASRFMVWRTRVTSSSSNELR